METHRALSKAIWVGFVAVVGLLTLVPNSVKSQNLPASPGARDAFSEVRDRQQREARLRSAEMAEPAKKLNTRELEEAAKQMREDFKGIQVMRNNVVRHLQSKKTLDYKFIASEAEEIRKRANRLKAHLSPEPVAGKRKKTVNTLRLATTR